MHTVFGELPREKMGLGRMWIWVIILTSRVSQMKQCFPDTVFKDATVRTHHRTLQATLGLIWTTNYPSLLMQDSPLHQEDPGISIPGATQVLVQSLVISRLNYCNWSLADLPLYAKLPRETDPECSRFSHTTSLPRSLRFPTRQI